MKIGFRIANSDYFEKFDLDIVQISAWHQGESDIERIRDLAERVKKNKKKFLIHPFGLYLSETRSEQRKYYLKMLKAYAQMSDSGLILHDETVPFSGPLHGVWSDAYKDGLEEIQKICPVSIENANDSGRVIPFWKTYARSIVFDIGHFEVAGVDCYEIINHLDENLINKLDYIHLHRKGEVRPDMGICDHWPLKRQCPEIGILKKLLEIRPDVTVILEVDGESNIKNSLDVLSEAIKREELL